MHALLLLSCPQVQLDPETRAKYERWQAAGRQQACCDVGPAGARLRVYAGALSGCALQLLLYLIGTFKRMRANARTQLHVMPTCSRAPPQGAP